MKNKKHISTNISEFLDSIEEGLSSPIPIKWTKRPNYWRGIFNIDDIKYEIFIRNKSKKEKHFLFKFQADGKYDMLKDVKKAFSVIPTIEGAAMDFIEEVKPQAFMFCAVDESATRKVMYDRFCTKVSKRLKYEYLKEKRDHFEFYILSKGSDAEDLEKSIMRIVEEQKP